MTDRREQKKKEFLAKTKLVGYNDTLFAIIDRVLDHNCKISCDDIANVSRCVPDGNDPNKPDHIWIAFGRLREHPLHFVWEILHEFGHHLSGRPKPGEDGTVPREELAWEYASIELQRYPDLAAQREHFVGYRERCLNSYRKREQENLK
jgi:hypothetical protein